MDTDERQLFVTGIDQSPVARWGQKMASRFAMNSAHNLATVGIYDDDALVAFGGCPDPPQKILRQPVRAAIEIGINQSNKAIPMA